MPVSVRWGAFANRWYVVASALWLIRYATLAHIPLFQSPIWADWFDQGRYLASATAFAHFDLSASAHWYPLAYSLLAAPLVWLIPSDPFFILDLFLYLLTCRAFQRVVARLDITSWPATLCFIAATLVQTGLASAWVQPWTTTLSAALIWWLIDRSLAVHENVDTVRTMTLVSIGALSAALPLTRPIDGLIGIVCLAFVGVTLASRNRVSFWAVRAVGAGGVSISSIYLALHLAIYGFHPTSYMIASARLGFIWSDLGWKAYVLLVSAGPWYPHGQAILGMLPWILPGCAGLLAGAIVMGDRHRRTILLLFATILPASIMMLAYSDLQPPGLWRFGNIHYFKWFIPAFGAGLLLCLRALRTHKERQVLSITLAALMLPLTVRIVPVAVNDQIPARLLLFKGATNRDWNEAYFSPAAITDDRGPLYNISGFHQLRDVNGERAVAISRLFASRPRRTDPGESPALARQIPYARFAERISFFGF